MNIFLYEIEYLSSITIDVRGIQGITNDTLGNLCIIDIL